MLTYIKRDLLSVKGPAILTHAVNCQGVMASGMAKEFKKKFPKGFRQYKYDCLGISGGFVGDGIVYDTDYKNLKMGCLFTSWGYGASVDTEGMILSATMLAVEDLCRKVRMCYLNWPIYSNKFNSGLFKVPWFKTETVLVGVLKRFPEINWVVCSELGER